MQRMIRLFIKNSPTCDLPFIRELKKWGIPFRVFGGYVPFEYRSRIMILLKGYPKLVYYATIAFFRSMSSGARPNIVVLQSDVEIFVFSAMKMLVPWIRFDIIFIGFIYTARRSMVHSKLRHSYYSLVLRNCARIICHSNTERERYGRTFPRVARRFVFMPGGAISGARTPSTCKIRKAAKAVPSECWPPAVPDATIQLCLRRSPGRIST